MRGGGCVKEEKWGKTLPACLTDLLKCTQGVKGTIQVIESVTPWSVSPVFVLVSTHNKVSPTSPHYLLPVSFVRQAYQRCSCCSWLLRVFPVLTILPALTLSLPFCTLSHHTGLLTSVCPDPETACRSVPFGLWSGLLNSACLWPVVLPALCSSFKLLLL
jgi:hypothetical protein